MSKRKNKTVEINVEAGGSNKKTKWFAKDPLSEKYADMHIEINGMNLPEICEKLWIKSEKDLRYEVKSYKYEVVGTNKTVCGESAFIEECKANIVLTYEKDKKDDILELVTGRFPFCTYSFK